VNSPFVLLGLEQRFDVIARIPRRWHLRPGRCAPPRISRALNENDVDANRQTLKKPAS
jgi:small subunit ribosomal protein S9